MTISDKLFIESLHAQLVALRDRVTNDPDHNKTKTWIFNAKEMGALDILIEALYDCYA